jgi:hypothetical protein
MKRETVARLATVFAMSLSVNAFADAKGNPYEMIVVRNPFGLRPISAIELTKPEVVPALVLPEIKLTGITTLLGPPKALFQYEDKQTKKVEFPSPLSEGETYKTLTVVSIDTIHKRVRINNGGTETTLDFINNGVKPMAVASVTPISHPSAMLLNASVPLAPTTSLAANANPYVIIKSGGTTSASPGAALTSQPSSRWPTMSREEAEALIEITRQKLQAQEQAGEVQRGQPGSSILPPTSLGEALRQAPAPVRR